MAAAILRYLPITFWIRHYPRSDLRADLIAGVTSWGVMVPVALAYAGLAGVPPEFGLVTAFAALAAYAIFATSRHLKVTTSSTMAIMSASLIAPIAIDTARYIALSAALALVVGVMLVAAGALRLGFISEFLAKPVVTGFIFGVALTIIVGQLPKLFGIPAGSGSVLDQLAVFVRLLPLANPWSLAVGGLSLLLIGALRVINRRIPGTLLALIVGIIVSTYFDLAAKGVATVGEVATGMPDIGLPAVGLTDLAILAAGAAGIVFLAMGESLGAARSFAARHRYDIDADQELIALGAANLSAGLFGGFTVDASLSQSATGEAAGTRSQVSSLLTAGLILATAIFLAPLFQALPQPVLGAIVIASVITLVDIAEMRRYWGWRRSDSVLAVVALVGVVTAGVLAGLVIAVMLSLLLLLYTASRPHLAVVGLLPGAGGTFGDVSRHPDAIETPGTLIVRIDAPLYFFNARVARSQILTLVDRRDPIPTLVVMDMSASADLDVTTTDMLSQLWADLADRGIGLALAGAKGAVRDRLRRTGFMSSIGEQRVYRSVPEAVAGETLVSPNSST